MALPGMGMPPFGGAGAPGAGAPAAPGVPGEAVLPGEAVPAARIVEDVAALRVEAGQVCVEPRAALAVERLGHESRA